MILPSCLLAAALHAAAPAAPAAADTARKPRLVAIMSFEARDVAAGEAASVAEAVGARLQASGRFRVMERAQMDRILAEQAFQSSGACGGGSCAIEIGKVLSTDAIVVGTLGRSGGSWTLSVRLVDVGSGEILKSASGHRKGSLDDVLGKLAPQTADLLAGTTRPDRTWLWVAAGGAAAAGIATTAVLLSADGSGSSSTGAPAHPETGTITGSWK